MPARTGCCRQTSSSSSASSSNPRGSLSSSSRASSSSSSSSSSGSSLPCPCGNQATKSFTISGLTGETRGAGNPGNTHDPNHCESLNGTWTLSINPPVTPGGPCLWKVDVPDYNCGGQTYFWQLTCTIFTTTPLVYRWALVLAAYFGATPASCNGPYVGTSSDCTSPVVLSADATIRDQGCRAANTAQDPCKCCCSLLIVTHDTTTWPSSITIN